MATRWPTNMSCKGHLTNGPVTNERRLRFFLSRIYARARNIEDPIVTIRSYDTNISLWHRIFSGSRRDARKDDVVKRRTFQWWRFEHSGTDQIKNNKNNRKGQSDVESSMMHELLNELDRVEFDDDLAQPSMSNAVQPSTSNATVSTESLYDEWSHFVTIEPSSSNAMKSSPTHIANTQRAIPIRPLIKNWCIENNVETVVHEYIMLTLQNDESKTGAAQQSSSVHDNVRSTQQIIHLSGKQQWKKIKYLAQWFDASLISQCNLSPWTCIRTAANSDHRR